MMKLCCSSIYEPFHTTFKTFKTKRFSLQNEEKANSAPVLYMKIIYIKNYRSVSLLPVFRNIFESLIYNAMLKNFLDDLISSNIPGFKPRNSCISQRTAITHKILKGLDHKDVFFGNDKVRHE